MTTNKSGLVGFDLLLADGGLRTERWLPGPLRSKLVVSTRPQAPRAPQSDAPPALLRSATPSSILSESNHELALAQLLENEVESDEPALTEPELRNLAARIANADVSRVLALWGKAIEHRRMPVAVAIAQALPHVIAAADPAQRGQAIKHFGRTLAHGGHGALRPLVKALLAADTAVPDAHKWTSIVMREHRAILATDELAASHFAPYW